MQKTFACTRLLKLSSMAALGMLFQAGGCALDPQALAASFVNTFSTILIGNFVSNFFGVGGLGF